MTARGSSLWLAFGWVIFSNTPLFISRKSTSLVYQWSWSCSDLMQKLNQGVMFSLLMLIWQLV